jgi:hypothetical protein
MFMLLHLIWLATMIIACAGNGSVFGFRFGSGCGSGIGINQDFDFDFDLGLSPAFPISKVLDLELLEWQGSGDSLSTWPARRRLAAWLFVSSQVVRLEWGVARRRLAARVASGFIVDTAC